MSFPIRSQRSGHPRPCWLGASHAQAIKLAVLQELSGAGATAGTNAERRAARVEINAAGGILGKQIETIVSDTQSNPGVAKETWRARRCGRWGVRGDGADLLRLHHGQHGRDQACRDPQLHRRRAASITQQGNPYIFRTSFTPDHGDAQGGALHRDRPEGEDEVAQR